MFPTKKNICFLRLMRKNQMHFCQKQVRRKTDWAVFLLALTALLAFNLSPIVIVLLAAAVGLAQYRQERHK